MDFKIKGKPGEKLVFGIYSSINGQITAELFRSFVRVFKINMALFFKVSRFDSKFDD